MNTRKISAVIATTVAAIGLLGACSSSTSTDTPTTAATSASAESSTPAATATDTASATAEDTATAGASQTPAVAQPSTMTLEVAGGTVSGHLVVANTDQGVADAEVSLVFRPDGGGDPKISSVTTGADGTFSETFDGGAGTWTASFLGNDAATASVATAKVG